MSCEAYLVQGWKLREFFEYEAPMELAEVGEFLKENQSVIDGFVKEHNIPLGFKVFDKNSGNYVHFDGGSIFLPMKIEVYVGYIQNEGEVVYYNPEYIFTRHFLAELFKESENPMIRALAGYFMNDLKMYLVKEWC